MSQRPHQPSRTVELVQKPAVGWFNLQMLITVAIQALITAATGHRTTRREVLAALDQAPHDSNPIPTPPTRTAVPDTGEDIWVDYVADLGDGFDATYSIAWLIGRDYLGLSKDGMQCPQPVPEDCMTEAPVADFQGLDHVLPAGSVTVFGGDLVYPTASRQNYEDRTIGPYHAARPWQHVDGNNAGRALYSIPGNHDWYDGLASYVHRFCQRGRWMGAWQVQQKRSYFAQRLGQGFSIWGIDLATAYDFDAAQLDYFKEQANLLEDNENVILCTPTPAWAKRDTGASDAPDSDAWRSIKLIMDTVGAAKGRGANAPRVAVVISGDHHHYVRHQETDTGQNPPVSLITCGGGGAFTLGTDTVPAKIDIGDSGEAEKQASFPDADESRKMRIGVFRMVFRHKLFCAALAAVMIFLVWQMQSASRALLGSVEVAFNMTVSLEETVLAALSRDFWDFLAAAIKTLSFTPALLLLVLGVLGGFIGFAHASRAKTSPVWAAPVMGTLHFLAQLAVAFVIAMLGLSLLGHIGAGLWMFLILLPFVILALIWLFTGLVFSTYIWISNALFKLHQQEIYSAQAIEGWKSFLRMRIGPEGLTIYPIGLRDIVQDWQPSPVPGQNTQAKAATPARGMIQRAMVGLGLKSITLQVPQGSTNLLRPATPLRPQLIEPAITIPRQGTAT
ncbi:MAG: metallophosphoesterase [Yoonia sp.]|uniref:metallophosphoesterase n=1 Tax=Yoonia sp. TaxID=2212373 RepID=UPI003EF23098